MVRFVSLFSFFRRARGCSSQAAGLSALNVSHLKDFFPSIRSSEFVLFRTGPTVIVYPEGAGQGSKFSHRRTDRACRACART